MSPRSKMTPSRPQKPFPLLELPAEIRNHIWRYIVIKDDHVTFQEFMVYPKSPETGLRVGNPVKRRLNDDEPRQTSMLAIAFTCRQLYLEVTPIYYGENVFRPSYSDYLLAKRWLFQSFAAAIGPTNANTITQLHLYDLFWFDDEYLDELPELKRLHFVESTMKRASNRITSFAIEHKSLTTVYCGEEWGPDKWKLHPPEPYW